MDGMIRDFGRDDADAVARLFQKTFRRSGTPSTALAAYLDDAFLNHPWKEPGISSRVFVEASGKISGFIGVFPARLELEGRAVKAAFASSLMVEKPQENPLAGARLVRAFLSGPQEISLTETANHTAMGLWRKAGHPLDPAYSLNWFKTLRPASTAVQMMAHRFVPAKMLLPFASVADRGIALFEGKPRQPQARKLTFVDVTPDAFADALIAVKDHYPVRPQWDLQAMSWFLGHAQQKRNLGHPEWRVGYGASGQPLAAYVYFSRPRSIGRVLQAISAPQHGGEMVEDLFAHAYERGSAALRGSGHPWLTPELMTRRAFFHSRSYYIVHSRDRSLLEAVRSGQALISGLAGESWTRLIGDRFD